MAVKKTTTVRTARTTSTKKTTSMQRGPEALGARLMASIQPVVPMIKPLPDFTSPAMREGRQQAEHIITLIEGGARISELVAALKTPLNVFAVFELRGHARRNEATEIEQQYARQRSENARKGGEATPMKLRATKDCVEAHWLDWQCERARYASNEKFAEGMTVLYENAKHGTVLRWCTAWRKKHQKSQ